MFLKDCVGWTATIVGTSQMLPQLIKLILIKKAGDLSLAMAALYVVNCILWLWYGTMVKVMPVAVANGIGGLIGIMQMILVVRYQWNT